MWDLEGIDVRLKVRMGGGITKNKKICKFCMGVVERGGEGVFGRG